MSSVHRGNPRCPCYRHCLNTNPAYRCPIDKGWDCPRTAAGSWANTMSLSSDIVFVHVTPPPWHKELGPTFFDRDSVIDAVSFFKQRPRRCIFMELP